MKKKMRQKFPKIRSKKGMTLIEILVGVVIIVIVFGSTLSAMTNGFATTLYNAKSNTVAVEGESVNEIILQAISKQGFATETEARNVLESEDNSILNAARAVVPDIVYVDNSLYDSSNEDNIFTVEFPDKSTISGNKKGRKLEKFALGGMIIKTTVKSTTGFVSNESFVPFVEQSGK